VRLLDLDLIGDVAGVGVVLLLVVAQAIRLVARLAEHMERCRLIGGRHPAIMLPGFPAVGVGADQP
jgi:hypothetical protein